MANRVANQYIRFLVNFALSVTVLFVIYVIVKVITGAGAFFDIASILTILVLALPENLTIARSTFPVFRIIYLSIELLVVFSLVGSQWLVWQVLLAVSWIKMLNFLIASFAGGLRFRSVFEAGRRRLIRVRGGTEEERGEEVSRRAISQRKEVRVMLIMILVVLPLSFGVIQATTAVVGNAYYLDGMVTKFTGYPSFFAFNSSDVRLVTADVAYAKARQHMASFGSNVHVENIHITIWDDRLVWTMTVVQQYWLGAGYDQRVYGYIVLSATDPNDAPLLVHQELALASGFGLNNRKDVLMQAYYRDPNYKYDRAILTKRPGGILVYAIPKYTVEPTLQLKAYGVDVWDAMTGTYIESYNLTGIPMWIPQPFDEGWLETQISNWGASRRGASFDIFAGGFIGVPVSNDRVAMDEDTRFVRYGSELISFTSMHPYATEQTLAGIFITDHSGIRYYDVSQLNMLSASRAKDVIQSQLYLPSAGDFIVEMPIIYNMSGYMAWLSPVYYVTGDTWQLKFVGIVNALDQSDVVVQDVTGMSARVGVETVTVSFISLVSSKGNTGTSIQGTIAGKWSYELAGNTNYYVNVTYPSNWTLLHGSQANMPTTDWVELVICSVGNSVNCTFATIGSVNEIIRFDVLEF